MTAMSLPIPNAARLVDCGSPRSRFHRAFAKRLPAWRAGRGRRLPAGFLSLLGVSLIGVSLFGLGWGAGAQAASDARSPAPSNAAEYFIDLKDGARVPLKLHLRFGLVNMGVAPAGDKFPGTGHHHIIIDSPLPPFDQPIPNDDNHIHLGAGQTEADVYLTPGPHTLQLMMGDHNHIPHQPPIYSQLIHVRATLPRDRSPADAAVYFIAPQDGQTVAGPMTLRFGLRSNMGVAPSSVKRPNTGHHNLVVDAETPDVDMPLPKDDKHMSFADGATETDLTLPPGQHHLQLVFTDKDGKNFDPPLVSSKITVTVEPAKQTGQ